MTLLLCHHVCFRNLHLHSIDIYKNELLKCSLLHEGTDKSSYLIAWNQKKSVLKVSYILRIMSENIRYLVQESCSVLLGSFVLHWNVWRVWAVQGCCQWQKDCQKREVFHPGTMFLLNLLFNFTELQLTHYTGEYKFNCFVKFWSKWSFT